MTLPASSANPFRFANFVASSRQELRDMTDVWLSDVCAAAWVSKEAQKLAGVVAEYLLAEKPTAVYARDFESKYNITSEEVNRGLKLLRLFAALEEFTMEKGRLTVAARVTLTQRVRLLELQARHRDMTAATADETATQCVEQLRAAASELQIAEAEGTPLPAVVNG